VKPDGHRGLWRRLLCLLGLHKVAIEKIDQEERSRALARMAEMKARGVPTRYMPPDIWFDFGGLRFYTCCDGAGFGLHYVAAASHDAGRA
jgi:hypothetical protein